MEVVVQYIVLPKGYSFIILENHPVIFNVMIDIKTYKVCVLKNFTNEPIKIQRNIRLTIIYKNIDFIYFVTDIINALKTLTLASILGQIYGKTEIIIF